MSIIEVLNGQYDWGIDSLVGQLREIRLQSLETRSRRNNPPKLPSKKELQVILDGLGACRIIDMNV
jgi:serine O-acetyltransferase